MPDNTHTHTHTHNPNTADENAASAPNSQVGLTYGYEQQVTSSQAGLVLAIAHALVRPSAARYVAFEVLTSVYPDTPREVIAQDLKLMHPSLAKGMTILHRASGAYDDSVIDTVIGTLFSVIFYKRLLRDG